MSNQDIQQYSLLRVWQIVGNRKKGINAILPISRSTFLARVKSGEYPAGIHIGARQVAWRQSEIMALLNQLGGGQ